MAFKVKQTWHSDAKEILKDIPNQEKIIKTLFAILNQIERNDWKGACHATCGVMHVILTEQGITNDLVLGEAKIENAFFNHSWIVINGGIYDVAIGNTLVEGFNSAPVFNGVDIDAKLQTKVNYGVNSGLADDPPTMLVKSVPLGYFLSNAPIHPTLGLWAAVLDAGMQLGLKFDLNKLKLKYSTVNWSKI